VKFILEEIKLQKITDITKIIFPIGMKGVCQSYFDRIFYDDYSYYEDKAAPFLEIIISIKTPISIEAIKSILNYDDFDVRQLVKKLDMFLELRDNTIMLIHKSIHDWLCNITLNDKYYISLNRGKKNLCGFIEREFTTYSNMIDEYVEEFGFKHLIEIGRFEKIAEIISKGLNNIHTLFFDFAKQLLLSNETHLLVNLFSIAAKEQYDVTNVSYVVAEVIKLMLQYGKKEVAENIVSCFKAKENYNQLIELLKFYEIKAFNNNTALIIEKGETIVNNKVYDIRILAEIARILGDAYRENGNHVRAVELYSDSKSKANEHKLDSLYLDCECALVDMEYVVGNVDTALCKLMILKSKIDFKTPDIYTYKYYRLLGHIFHIKSAQNDAMNAFSESLNIANALSFSLKQIETYNSLAELQNNFSIAKIYLEEGRKLSAVTGLNSLEFGKSFYIEASLLLKESKYKEALNCVEKAIQILENVGYGSGCARSYLIKGKILFQTEFYNEAVIYLERAGKYYIRECIYPTFRLEVYFFVLKCAEKIDQITKYKNFDVLDYFDINQFPHMKSIFETINLTK